MGLISLLLRHGQKYLHNLNEITHLLEIKHVPKHFAASGPMVNICFLVASGSENPTFFPT